MQGHPILQYLTLEGGRRGGDGGEGEEGGGRREEGWRREVERVIRCCEVTKVLCDGGWNIARGGGV